jgi:inner membrane protein
MCWQKLKNKTIYTYFRHNSDLDVVVGLFLDPVNAVLIHRELVIRFFLFLSPLGWIVSKQKRTGLTSSMLLIWLLCLFTHVLLDMFTSWDTSFMAFRL